MKASSVVGLVTVLHLSVVCSMSAGKAPSLPAFLSDALSGKSWEECGREDESCYVSEECCGKLQCLPTKNFRGPQFACRDVPSRSYRHLGPKPVDAVGEGVRTNLRGEAIGFAVAFAQPISSQKLTNLKIMHCIQRPCSWAYHIVAITSYPCEDCNMTAECMEGLCCQKLFIFRRGLLQKCEIPNYFTDCV